MKKRKTIIQAQEGKDHFYQEQIKNFRSKIIHFAESSGENVIGISSASPEEGKTTVSFNLSSALASVVDKKVMLIDCDLRKCDMTRSLGLYGKIGLTEFLSGKEEKISTIINNSKVKNLDIIASGAKSISPSEMLIKGVFKTLIEFLRQRYDFVIVDLPPIMSTADPISVKEIVDKFILVYLSGKTPTDLFEFCINELGREKILGAVLNGVNVEKIMRYRKYRKYYYAY